MEDLTFLPKTDASGNPVLDANGHPAYQAFHNGRVDVIPDGTSSALETVIAHPPTVYGTSVGEAALRFAERTVPRNRSEQ